MGALVGHWGIAEQRAHQAGGLEGGGGIVRFEDELECGGATRGFEVGQGFEDELEFG